MQEKGNPLEYPFLDYKGIMYVLGGVRRKSQAYKIIHDLLNEKNANGGLLIGPRRMLNIGKLVAPTDVLCERFGTDRDRYK